MNFKNFGDVITSINTTEKTMSKKPKSPTEGTEKKSKMLSSSEYVEIRKKRTSSKRKDK